MVGPPISLDRVTSTLAILALGAIMSLTDVRITNNERLEGLVILSCQKDVADSFLAYLKLQNFGFHVNLCI